MRTGELKPIVHQSARIPVRTHARDGAGTEPNGAHRLVNFLELAY